MENTQPLPKMPANAWNENSYQKFNEEIAKCYQPSKDKEARVQQCYEAISSYDLQYKKRIQSEIPIGQDLKPQDLDSDGVATTPKKPLAVEIKADAFQNSINLSVEEVNKSTKNTVTSWNSAKDK